MDLLFVSEDEVKNLLDLDSLLEALAEGFREVLLNLRPGRRSDDELTVYKSMGHAMEDMVAANLVYKRAIEASAGKVVSL